MLRKGRRTLLAMGLILRGAALRLLPREALGDAGTLPLVGAAAAA